MKTRRTLATAVAAALTAPVLLLAAGPASAATVTPPPARPAVSAAPDTFEKGRSIADLEKAVEEARKAHEAAVAAKKAADEKVLVAVSDDTPEAIAAAAAKKAAETAAAAHTAAVKALEEAEAKLAALPDTATPEERATAEKAVKEARAVVEKAAAEKATADKKRADAGKALSDMRVAAFEAVHQAEEAIEEAAADLADAEKALADAKKDAEDDDGMCEGDDRLVAELTGLPARVTAGSTVDLTVRVTNNTGETVDRAYGQIGLAPGTKSLVTLFKPQYSTGTSTQWRDWNSWGVAVDVGELEPGAHADLRLRLNPAASLKDWSGRVEVSGWYERGDDCGANTTMKVHRFQVVAAPAASPSPSPSPTPSSVPSPQGGTTTPIRTTTTTGGTLAKTGSSDALNGLALASGAALLLGTG
ncbi:peptidase, partial [Streptomyces sp. Act-28]